MSHAHDHTCPPQPERGCYMLREVHHGKAEGVFISRSQQEEGLAYSAAAILAVQGYACRLVRLVDEARFAAQSPNYRTGLLPGNIPELMPQAEETAAQLASRMAKAIRENAQGR